MFSRLKAIWRAVRDGFPFTWLGLLVAGGSGLAVAYYGYGEIDMLLLAVGLVGAGVSVLSLLGTLLTVLVTRLRVRKRVSGTSQLAVECGFPSRTGFAVGRPWILPFVRIGWSWASPPARVKQVKERGRKLAEEVIPLGRGLREQIIRRFVVGDVFGLTRVSWRHTEKRPVRVLPSVGGLKQMHVVRSLSGGEDLAHPDGTPEGERIDLRNYVPGDPIKYILWKVFARHRTVVVRTPERALAPAKQTVAYLVAADGDEPAAGAARVAVDVGALGGDWVFGADGVDMHARTKDEALECLARSSSARPEQQGAGLGAFLREASPGQSGRAVVFVPGKPGPWLDRVVAAGAEFRGQGGGSALEFIVCTDGVRRDDKRGVIKKVAYRSIPDKVDDLLTPVLASQLGDVVRKLGSLRGRVLVIDRRDGRILGSEHQRRLEAA